MYNFVKKDGGIGVLLGNWACVASIAWAWVVPVSKPLNIFSNVLINPPASVGIAVGDGIVVVGCNASIVPCISAWFTLLPVSTVFKSLTEIGVWLAPLIGISLIVPLLESK